MKLNFSYGALLRRSIQRDRRNPAKNNGPREFLLNHKISSKIMIDDCTNSVKFKELIQYYFFGPGIWLI